VPAVLNQKIFVRLRARVTNSDCLSITPSIRGRSGGIHVIGIQNNPVSGQWYTLSGIAVVDTTFVGDLFLRINSSYPDGATSLNKTTEIQEVLIIDLTATFGVGNEPTKEECDKIFANW